MGGMNNQTVLLDMEITKNTPLEANIAFAVFQ